MKVSDLIGQLVSYISQNGDRQVELDIQEFNEEGKLVLEYVARCQCIKWYKDRCILWGSVNEL